MHLTQITNSSHCSVHQESRAMQSMGEKWDTSSASSILEIAGAAVPAVPCRWVWMQCHWCGVLQIGVDAVPAPSSDGCGCSASGILQMGVDAVPAVSCRLVWMQCQRYLADGCGCSASCVLEAALVIRCPIKYIRSAWCVDEWRCSCVHLRPQCVNQILTVLV